ncbi:hypothetical protein [Candidatus Magnetobacterium casense]|uniref:Uncharacterized protein n=1 Tax=Candidatus Magnetobacterium casense TaxID=1455061 RepID=A0ABS6S435_9BACT|nr:hypothetical protein [Candidatus Magnetobacterium casensis]MBV6343606.1 hypothetical protein [Candidatus Magnetobacterium casensis]
MYKLTRPDGFDFYSGTINYRENIGKIIRVTDFDPATKGPCGKGLHASKNPNDCFVGANIPCAAFRVKGIQPIASDTEKTRYQALKILEEITNLDDLFGWRYSEAINPIHPFKIKPPKITDEHIQLVEQWDSVRASVGDSMWPSVRASVGDSVRASVGDSVWAIVGASVRASVRDSVGDSVWASVRASVGDSVRASVGAYIGSLFPNITEWKYAPKTEGYPYQSCVDLWKQGLVPSYDGNKWRLHSWPEGKVLWTE